MPVVRAPSLTHIAQVCGGWTVKNLVNAKLRPGRAQVLEETPPAAEQHGCQRDFQLVDDTQVQVLLDHIRSTRDTNVTTACGLPSQLQGTLRPIIDEVKGRPTGAHPGFAFLIGKNVYRCVKRSLLWPGALALVEHSLAHNVGTDALRGAANQVIDRAGLSPWSELEVLSQVLLIEEPGHQRTPLSAPVLVPGILHGHSFRCHVAIEAKSNVDEYFAHDSLLACSDVGLTLLVTGPRKEAKPTGAGPVDQRVRRPAPSACAVPLRLGRLRLMPDRRRTLLVAALGFLQLRDQPPEVAILSSVPSADEGPRRLTGTGQAHGGRIGRPRCRRRCLGGHGPAIALHGRNGRNGHGP